MPRRHRTHEQTINTALAEVLEGFGHRWRVESEQIGGVLRERGLRPDIFMIDSEGRPVIIEAEVSNYQQAEIEAASRLGAHFSATGRVVETSIALVYPDELRNYRGVALRQAIRESTLEYAVLTSSPSGEVHRVPNSGWLSSDVMGLAMLLHRTRIPSWKVDSLADELERGVASAEGVFSRTHAHGSDLGVHIARLLGQRDDTSGQARRMAMAVIANALVFHEALVEAETPVVDVRTHEQRSVRSPRELRRGGSFSPTLLLDEWQAILEVNYWPIFHTAGDVLRLMPTATASTILDGLWQTAESLVAGGVTRSHDLTGVVFQRLIADRRFLATFYTRPAAAALLAGLALPINRPPRGRLWNDRVALAETRIGDFACGTGTLLSTAYQRFGLLHELHGGNPEDLHPAMMRYGLVGLDVLNIAVHLTATMLASVQPGTPFEGECLLTMPYGTHPWGAALGSLDLLQEQIALELMQAAAVTAGSRGEDQVRDLIDRVGHGQFDLVIMNPPFTRSGAREGENIDVRNPAFAAFEATEAEQIILERYLHRIGADSCGHGRAGMASYFVELAHRKASPSGTIALVLPLTAMGGVDWQKVRTLFRESCSSLLVVTIAERGTHSRSFSADTGMAECLVVAKNSEPVGDERRALFAILHNQPQTTLDGELIAQKIMSTISEGQVRKLEEGPFGGTRLSLGDCYLGEILDCPLPSNGPWPLVGIRNICLAQTAYQMEHGRLWIEGMPLNARRDVPMAYIRDVSSRIGPHDLDITGSLVKSDGLPQGPFEHFPGLPDGVAYPCLWNHHCSLERSILVQPDSHCRVREVGGHIPDALQQRAANRWATASRVHYNRDLQFNSQSLVVAITRNASIGGRAWPTVVIEDRSFEYAFALWCNSTLGLLCHWWMSSKTQSGRGCTSVDGIPNIPSLDIRMLTPEQHAIARDVFESIVGLRFLPFDQIDEDSARAELDRLLLTRVLHLDPVICEPGGCLDLLRRQLSAEPQIHGGKASRVVFDADGEEHSEQREPR